MGVNKIKLGERGFPDADIHCLVADREKKMPRRLLPF